MKPKSNYTGDQENHPSTHYLLENIEKNIHFSFFFC